MCCLCMPESPDNGWVGDGTCVTKQYLWAALFSIELRVWVRAGFMLHHLDPLLCAPFDVKEV